MNPRLSMLARFQLTTALFTGLAGIGCSPAADVAERLQTADWTFSGCSDIVLMAISADQTLAIGIELEVDASELEAPVTYNLSIDGHAAATLYEGLALDESLLCGASTSAAATGGPEVSHAWGARSGQITLNVVPGGNPGGRTASAAVRELTFVVSGDELSVDLNIDPPVIVGQY